MFFSSLESTVDEASERLQELTLAKSGTSQQDEGAILAPFYCRCCYLLLAVDEEKKDKVTQFFCHLRK